MPDERKYSDVELREILERALAKQAPDAAGITQAELLAIGQQVGVSPEAMARAAEEVSRAKLDAEAGRAVKSRQQKWLAAHAAGFAVVNGLLFTVNYLTTPGEWWVLFSVFFWGLVLVAHAGIALALGSSSRALESERRKLGAAPSRIRVEAVGAAAHASDEAEPALEGDADPRVASRP
jgi:hypothetical protein